MKLAEQTEFAQNLNAQLDELVLAKKEHEDTLLEKCAILINEKKGKIRDQQRLLAVAKVGPKKLGATQAARRPGSPSRQAPGPSAKGKRKASALAHSVNGDDDEENGFEDPRIKAEEVEEEQQPDSEDVTPEHSDLDETEDDLDDADTGLVPAPTTAKGKVTEESESTSGVLNGDLDEDLPPRRKLPFMKDQPEPSQASNNLDEDQDTKMADDDETDDDEL